MKAGVVLGDGTRRDVIVEVLESGEPRVDWETMVGYQPMPWAEYVEKRPAGESLDFRVQVSRDTFYSHEFADSAKWSCFRLVSNANAEAIFGYAPRGGDLERQVLETIRSNGGGAAPVILRLMVPEGIQSRRGVVIEKLMSARWIYIESPDAGA